MTVYNRIDISGVSYSDIISARVVNTIGENNISSGFNIRLDNVAGRHKSEFTVGNEIEIYADIDTNPATTKIFNGILENIEFAGDGTKNRDRIFLSGRDYTARLQDRTVEPEVYTNLPAGSIVKDIVNKYTDDITVTNVNDSPTLIPRISFNQTPVYDAVQELAKLAGYMFYIDINKDLHFKQKGTVSSNLTFSSGNTIKVNFKEDRDSVFNEVWVYGDRYLDNFQESFTGDAAGSVFTLTYKPHNTEVTVDAATQRGGILNMALIPESGTDYLVSYQDKNIVFVSGTTLDYSSIPGGGAAVLIKYDRSLPIVKVGKDNASITSYKKRVLKITDTEIKDPNEAAALVASKLAEFSIPKKEGNLLVKGIVDITPGETCIVDFPWQDVNNQTYDIIESKYLFNKFNNLEEMPLTVIVNKKISDASDRIKEMESRIRKLESKDIDIADIITRLEYTTGSMGIRTSGLKVSSSIATGTVGLLYSTTFVPPVAPFHLAPDATQAILAGSWTLSGPAYGPFIVQWSGGYF